MPGGGISRAIGLLLAVFASAVTVSAQIDRGTIQGVVTDQSGGIIPGAKVQIVRIDTNSALDLSTNEEGFYTAPNLPVGDYRVVVEQAGFSMFKREPIEVRTGVQIRVDVTLQTGGITETVSVTDEAPLLDTATMNNAAGFKEDLIQQLPVIVVGTKRDVTGFLNNLPGTTNANTFTPSVNGAPIGATETFLDGAPSSERILVGAFSEVGPMMEQVGEVSIVANAFNAEYGGFGNWFANVTIKSGTNQFHGSVFDHLGNDKLNARSFFQPKRTPYRQNEGGFALGGPVVIPGLYNGRDKTFFFGSLGFFFSRYGASGNIITIPTQAMLRGDFSDFRDANGNQIPIFDPATTVPDGSGGFRRTQFPGNITDGLLWPALGLSSADFRGPRQDLEFPAKPAESRRRRPFRRAGIHWIRTGTDRRRLPGRLEERFRTTTGPGLSSECEDGDTRVQWNKLLHVG
jgi:hypothetical protein